MYVVAKVIIITVLYYYYSIMAVLSSATLLFFLVFIDIGRLFMHIRYCNVFCIFILLKVADMLIP